MQGVQRHLIETTQRGVGADRCRHRRVARNVGNDRTRRQRTRCRTCCINLGGVLVRRRNVEACTLPDGIDVARYRGCSGLPQVIPGDCCAQADQACSTRESLHRGARLAAAAATFRCNLNTARVDHAILDRRRGLPKQTAVSHRAARAQTASGNRACGVAGLQPGFCIDIDTTGIDACILDCGNHLILFATQRQQAVRCGAVELREMAAVQLAGQ